MFCLLFWSKKISHHAVLFLHNPSVFQCNLCKTITFSLCVFLSNCFQYHEDDPKDLFSLRLTAARTTVTSSTLPPATLPNPFARAFLANGDKKFSSCDNLRAINAMEFAHAWKKNRQNYYEFYHYSKSQIFVQKFKSDKTPTFSRVFHPNFFANFFSWNQSCQQLKSSKPQHFHEFLDKNWTFNIVCSLGFFSIFRALWSGVTFSKVHLELKKRKKKI